MVGDFIKRMKNIQTWHGYGELVLKLEHSFFGTCQKSGFTKLPVRSLSQGACGLVE